MFGRYVLASILFLFSVSSYAAKRAVVIVDGAMVYKKGDFGSPVLGYLRKGKKVKVSNKTYGPFYRVKLRQGIVGYISDVDVKVFGKSSVASRKNKRRSRARRKAYRGRPVIAGKKFGLGFSSVNYVDRFPVDGAEKVLSSSTSMLTAKYSKPFDYLDGAMISDITVGMTLGTPALYNDFSVNPASGFVVVGDYSLLMPVRSMTNRKSSIYWGAGLGFSYSNVKISTYISSVLADVPAEDFRIGGSLTAGYAYRINRKYIFKFEPKFYLEKERYYGLHFVVQKNLN